jgi:hypothetical protein
MIKFFILIATFLPLSLYVATLDKKAIATKGAPQQPVATLAVKQLPNPAAAPVVRSAQSSLPVGWILVAKAVFYWVK